MNWSVSMKGTFSFTNSGSTSSASMPHALALDIRRRSSSIRSSVRAISKPPDSVKTPISWYCAHRVEREVGDLPGVVDREDEVRRVPGRAAGVGQRPLVDLHDVAPAEPARWWTRLLPTMPAPMTTTLAEVGTVAMGLSGLSDVLRNAQRNS